MPITARPGETYTIRRKFFKIFGAAFHVYDSEGHVAAYCKQKALKLREDIRLYTDETCTTELLTLKTRSIIDFGATYDVALPTGELLGSLRRKGLMSSFVRDSWLVFDADGREIAALQEKGTWLSVLRRFHELIAAFSPQTFEVHRSSDGAHIATFRQHFNLLVYRLGIAFHADDPELDELTLLAAACLIAAIEGRQN